MDRIILHSFIVLALTSTIPALAELPAFDITVSATETPLLLAVRTGDDDDIDDLIIERANKRTVDRAPASKTGSSVTETEDDLYVGNKPNKDNTAAAAPPPATTSAASKLPNCGTHWTGWAENLDQAPNPCPSGCEPGEQQLVKNYQQDGKTLYSARYQCHMTAKVNAPLVDSQRTLPVVQTTCPDMVRGFNQDGAPNGGQYEIPQGWFYEARVKTAQNGMILLECNYGRHGRDTLRASSHTYLVTYRLNGVRADRCNINGATVTCRK